MGLSEIGREAVRRNIFAAGLASVDVALLVSPSRFEQPAPSPWSVALTETLERNGPWDLVCFDPVSRWSGVMQENDNVAGTLFVQTLERFTALPGRPAVLSAMHTPKSERGPGAMPAMPRGASAYYDGTRWVVSLSEDRGGGVIFTHTKSNYTAKHDPILLVRGAGGALAYGGPAPVRTVRCPAGSDLAARIRAYLLEHPDAWLTGRQLRAVVGDPSHDRFASALSLLGGEVTTKPGPRNSTLYAARPPTGGGQEQREIFY
jgi:hypothetical protein